MTKKIRILGLLVVSLAIVSGCASKDTPPDGAVRDASTGDAIVSDGGMTDAAVSSDGKIKTDTSQADLGPDLAVSSSPWKEMATPFSAPLYATWGRSTDDMYAAGKEGLILRYNGKSWQKITNSDKEDLLSAWGEAAGSNVYFLSQGSILKYNGTDLETIYGGSGFSFYELRGLWGVTNDTDVTLWAVGGYGYIQTKTLSAEGAFIKSKSNTTADLYAIWGAAANDIYAVGDNGTIVHFNGAEWLPVDHKLTKSHLRSVWGSAANDVYAVGLDGVVLHYDGKTWTKAGPSSGTYFQSIWGSASNDIYLVGHPLFKSDESIFHFDGASWQKMAPPLPSFANAVFGVSTGERFVAGNFNLLTTKKATTPQP